jgi:hypothetical protein
MMEPNIFPESPSGAWVFVSHSNTDIAGVRGVRDELERMGHYPLLFFLKCISAGDELDALIKREIEARNFFLLCDSPSARASAWVQREVEYIQALPNRVWRKVDLEADPVAQLGAIRELSANATVFLSYAHADSPAVARIQQALLAAEYRVWSNDFLTPGARWQERIEGGIARAIHEGFVIVFITPEALASHWVRHEIETALDLVSRDPQAKGRIVPVMLRGGQLVCDALPAAVRSIQFLDVSGLPPTEAGQRLIQRLRQS